jgi:hypothetical protein
MALMLYRACSAVLGSILKCSTKGKSPPYLTPCSRPYGIIFNHRASQSQRGSATLDPYDGIWKIKNSIKWLIRKGDILPNDVELMSANFYWRFNRNGDASRSLQIITSDSSHAPSTLDDFFPGTHNMALLFKYCTQIAN